VTRLPTEQCAAFIGIDWADAQHAICLPAAGSEQRACRVLDHQPDTSNAGGSPWRTRFQGQPRALCLERHKGPLVSARRQPDVLVLFPVKPLTLARYREACTPSQAQDDPTDAALQLALWLKPRAKLKPLQPQSPPRRALAQLVASRRRLVGDQVRLTHRLPSTLTNSFPHALPWCHDKDTTSFWDVLTPWPTRKAVPLARRSSLERCFREPHVRDPAVINQRIDAIQSAPPRTTAAGVLTPHVLLVQALVPPRRATLHTIAAFDQAIAPRAQSPPAFPFFDTLPGAGAVLAPRLLVAFGAQRDRYASADALQKYAGLAPVTARRGNKAWGHWRLQCPPCLRQTCVAWAAASTRHACWARAYDQQPRDQGASHQAAVRALAFTWLRMLFRCWQNRTPYHASVYLNALERRGSPLLTQRHQGSEKIVHDP
jgi:Transposase IS116/IS110/IS902 family/Transposase